MNFGIKRIARALIVASLAISGCGVCLGRSAEADRQMASEREDFLSGMPVGLQGKQRRAIERAIRGDGSNLQALRAGRNKASASLSADVERVEITLPGGAGHPMRGRLYRPKNVEAEASAHHPAGLPLLLYFHGGGWTIGSVESCAAFCDSLAASGAASVLAVDYRLAPENPWPAPLDDCVAAARYAVAHASDWGCDPTKVSLGGDSSGGNLALCAALQTRDEGLPINSILAIYPVVKAYPDGSGSWREYGGCYGLDSDLMEAFNDACFAGMKPEKRKAAERQASPADYSDAELKRLPPVFLLAAGKDILRDQGIEFVERLQRLGVPAQREELSEAVHLFITVAGQPAAFGEAVGLAEMLLNR